MGRLNICRAPPQRTSGSAYIAVYGYETHTLRRESESAYTAARNLSVKTSAWFALEWTSALDLVDDLDYVQCLLRRDRIGDAVSVVVIHIFPDNRQILGRALDVLLDPVDRLRVLEGAA